MSKETTCPTCGRCPTCGHEPEAVKVVPVPMPYPQPYPVYPQPWNPWQRYPTTIWSTVSSPRVASYTNNDSRAVAVSS